MFNGYRAGASGRGSPRAAVPDVKAPTLYVWSDADATVGRAAAEATARHVSGPYRLLATEGAGHFPTDQAGEQVTRAIVEHVARDRG